MIYWQQTEEEVRALAPYRRVGRALTLAGFGIAALGGLAYALGLGVGATVCGTIAIVLGPLGAGLQAEQE